MAQLLLNADGRRLLLEAIGGDVAPPAAAAMLQPAGTKVETSAEIAALLARFAPIFAQVDYGIVVIDHRRRAGFKIVVGLAASAETAFIVDGTKDGEMRLGEPIPTWALVSELTEAIGFPVPTDEELEAAEDDEDSDDEPGPSTETTTGVVAALATLFAGAPDAPVDRAEALGRFDGATVPGADIISGLIQDELVAEDGAGRLVLGSAALRAPGLTEAATGDRLELVRFRLPESEDGELTDGDRLTFLGPPFQRHTVLREPGSPEIVIARLPLEELALLLTLFVSGRPEPALVPVRDPGELPPAPEGDQPAVRFTSADLEAGVAPFADALNRPAGVVEVASESPVRMGVYLAPSACVAWTWTGSEGTARLIAVEQTGAALAEFLSAFPDDETYLELRHRAGGAITGASVAVARGAGADAIERDLRAAGWPPSD